MLQSIDGKMQEYEQEYVGDEKKEES